MAHETDKNPDSGIARVYVYHGADDVLKREAIERLRNQVIAPEFEDFDFETMNGPEVTVEKLMLAAGILPFASPKRMVVITQANGIPSTEQQELADKLDRLTESACVVFVVLPIKIKDGKPKRGSGLHPELMKAARKIGKVIEFAPMKDDQAVGFVRKLVSEAEKTISGTAAAAVVRRCGTDSGVLRMEVTKLIAFTGERKTIGDEDVAQVTTETVEEKIFTLMDSIGARNTGKALRLLQPIIHGAGDIKKEAPGTLGLLAWHFRMMWQARVLLDEGRGVSEDIAAMLPSDNILKKPEWQRNKFAEQARNFTLDELTRCFDRIAQADLAIKGIEGAVADPAMALELLVTDLSKPRAKKGAI